MSGSVLQLHVVRILTTLTVYGIIYKKSSQKKMIEKTWVISMKTNQFKKYQQKNPPPHPIIAHLQNNCHSKP